MATVISLANQKGGVAKTTTCINLGSGLALRGYRTLLIDFDPQASLSIYFGINGQEEPLGNVGDWIMGRKTFEKSVRVTEFPNLSVVPTSEDLKSDELTIQQDMVKSFRYLQRRIDSVRASFDFILIDTMPSFSLLFLNSLAACDKVLIPVKLEFLSIQGLEPLGHKIQDICEELKPIEVLGILGTFYRNGVNESDTCVKELREALQDKVFDVVINQNATLSQAAAHSKPIQHFDKNSQGCKDYDRLTEEVLSRCQIQVPAGAAR